jgi:hypothetical protein
MSDVKQKTSREEIEKRAYRLFEERGYRDGHALEDWIDAETELINTDSIELAQSASTGRRQS